MAVIVKEASKTPLAIATLASNWANTYADYTANAMKHDVWKQEQVWKNQDYVRKTELADKLAARGAGGFKGGDAGMLGAIDAVHNNRAFDDYLLDADGGAGANPYNYAHESQIDMLAATFVRQNGMDPQTAKDYAAKIVLGGFTQRGDPLGIGVDYHDWGKAASGSNPVHGRAGVDGVEPSSWTAVINYSSGGQNAQTFETQADAELAARAGRIQDGEVVKIGQSWQRWSAD